MLPESNKENFSIHLVNFDKHQIRKDVYAMNWIKLNSMMPMDDKLILCSVSTRWVFICLLCFCARQGSSEVRVNIKLMSSWCQVTPKCVRIAINKLKEYQMLNIEKRDVDVPKIREDKIREEYNAQCPPLVGHRATVISSFDFESLYHLFPRKAGKARGIDRCKKHIKSQKKFDQLETSIKNYASYVERNSIEQKYVKHFSTFMSDWTDWLDPPEDMVEEDFITFMQKKGYEV